MEIAGDIAHLRDPVPIILTRPKRPAGRVAELRPEGRIGVGRHLEIAEALVRDQRFDLRAIDVVIELLGRGEVGTGDSLQPAQHILPVALARLLRPGVDFRQVIPDRFLHVFVAGELLLAPLPLRAVDGPQPGIRRPLS